MYNGAAEHLQDVGVAVRASLLLVLEHVSVADIANGRLPDEVAALVADHDAWQPR